jgi:hypothetical protein
VKAENRIRGQIYMKNGGEGREMKKPPVENHGEAGGMV